ncbi:MAG: ATP-binding protein [Desulforhopalus sp.]
MASSLFAADTVDHTPNCDILQIINDFCLSYEQELCNKDLLLSTRVDPDLPRFFIADPSMIMQLLHELSQVSLVQDARGCVVLDFKAEQENEDRYFISITITMSGNGIPGSKEKDLFSPYKMKDGKTTGETGPTLYYARKISRFYDGDISVKNSFGFGTRFMVKIRLSCMDE